MLAILGALPIIGNIITALTTAFFNAKVSIVQAQIGGDVEKAKALVSAANAAQHERTASLGVIAGNKVLTWLVVFFSSPLIIYYAKCLVWDKVLGWGSTDPLGPELAQWSDTIIWAIFGSGGAVTIASMWFNKKG